MSLEFGTWAPVCGGWLRILNAERDVSPGRLVALAQQMDRLAYDLFYVNGGDPGEVEGLVRRAKAAAREHGRTLKVALSAFGLVRATTREALSTVDGLKARVDSRTVDYFRTQIDSAVVAHNRGTAADHIEANLGITSGLVGDARSIRQRLHAFEDAGVDAVIVKFEPAAEEAERFAREVIAPYRSARARDVASPV